MRLLLSTYGRCGNFESMADCAELLARVGVPLLSMGVRR